MFPQIFDATLLASTALLDWRTIRLMESFEQEACRMPGVELTVHRFGGLGFIAGKHEFAHLHGNGLLDAFVGVTERNRVVRSGMALAHHVFARSGWVSYWIQTEADLPNALELMRIAQRYRAFTESTG